MNILMLNQDWFAKELREAGHKVATCGLATNLEIIFDQPLVPISQVIRENLGGEEPDLFIFHDNSAPVVFTGIDARDTPFLFYSVDTHHHSELHRAFLPAVDHMLVAQRDYIPILEGVDREVPVEWFPLWASCYVEPAQPKQYGASFVGTLNPTLHPERVEFFDKLKKAVDIELMQGDFRKIFASSQIVVNQTVKGDLNFRVFESMICGAMLLTERSENGLLELFKEDQQLALYKKGDVKEAADKISYYLNHPEEAARIAAAGRAEILANHLPANRAKRILEIASSLAPRKKQKYRAWMRNYYALGERLKKFDNGLRCKSILHAAEMTRMALLHGELFEEDDCFYLVQMCSVLDQISEYRVGATILEEVNEQFPNFALLKLSRIRSYLNRGERQQALLLAKDFSEDSPDSVFQNAERVVSELLRLGDGQQP